jgi:hypothetical protein
MCPGWHVIVLVSVDSPSASGRKHSRGTLPFSCGSVFGKVILQCCHILSGHGEFNIQLFEETPRLTNGYAAGTTGPRAVAVLRNVRISVPFQSRSTCYATYGSTLADAPSGLSVRQ